MDKQFMRPVRVVVGISGASGAALGQQIVRRLADEGTVEVHLVVSAAAEKTFAHELGPDALIETVEMAHSVYEPDEIGAAIASGSFPTDGMIVAPCSIRTLSAIANSLNDTLLIRAADVHLKERRRLVLGVREAPLHMGHLDLMRRATQSGAIIFPPVPAFYVARSMREVIDQTACRMIDLLGLPLARLARDWRGLDAARQEL